MNNQTLNLHQKLLKITEAAGVLQRTKEGYGYKYVPEEEIQAKVTGGMLQYGVNLYTSLVPGTLTITPYQTETTKTRSVEGEDKKFHKIDVTVPVFEVIVSAEVEYTWVDVDDPTQVIKNRWAYIGQMGDASQAFGAGATYGNRYFLMKSLQLATTEDDPDAYRSKQRKVADYEDEKEQQEEEERLKKEQEAIRKAKKEVSDAGVAALKAGVQKDELTAVVAKHNGGNGNPASIKAVDVCNAIVEELKVLTDSKKPAKKKPTEKETSQKGETK